MRLSSIAIALVAAGSVSLGCSAIVQPDIRRLGGTDGGGLDAPRGDTSMDDTGARDGGTDVPRPDVPVDGGPVCPTSCDDSIDCTVDTCQAGLCVNTPNEMLCSDAERCSPLMGCVPNRCRTSADCDNGVFCDGMESCDASSMTPTGCVRGTPPVCDDGFACTVDRCDEGMNDCVNEANDAACNDSVACTADRCEPGSGARDGCVHEGDDALCATLYCRTGSMCTPGGCTMGAMRTCADSTPCTIDTCDEGARSCVFTPRDDDMDGAHPISASTFGGPAVLCAGGTDCNDFNAAVRPGATELCNAIDDNCNMMVDEGCPPRLPDDCSTAQVITVSGSGTFTLPMPLPTFGALRDDYDGNPICPAGDTMGRDAVYALDIVGRRDVVIDTIGSASDTILNVAFTCDATSFTGASVCSDDFNGSAGTASRIWLHRVGTTGVTTRVYVLVDAYRGSDTGTYQLNVRWGDAIGDGCISTSPLDITGGGTVLGFVTNTSGFHSGSCGSSTPEGVMRFDGPASGNVRLTTYSSFFGPDIYLRTACGSGELACVNSTPISGTTERAEIRRSVTAGAAHYFFVDGGATNSAYAVFYEPF